MALTRDLESSYDPRALHGGGRKVMATARHAWNPDIGNVRSKNVSHRLRVISSSTSYFICINAFSYDHAELEKLRPWQEWPPWNSHIALT